MNAGSKRAGLLLTILVIGILVVVGCGSGGSDLPTSKDEVPRISAQELKNKLDRGEGVLVVDSRSAGAFEQSHVAGALSVPVSEVESRLDEFPQDQEIVFY